MPEIKNTFLKSRMNKDLDSRLIPNGEYRHGENISISASEGSDVGALENIRGNTSVAIFGIDDNDLEIIGHYVDTANGRIFFFLTNNNEETSQSTPDLVKSGSSVDATYTISKDNVANYITYIQVDSDSNIVGNSVLVSGNFLNFSKNSEILNVNLIENLLFWTDDRNQPRKINVDRAISDSNYYSNEDHVSVAKYAPFKPISFIKRLNKQDELSAKGTLKNELDEFLPASISFPAVVGNFDGRDFLRCNSPTKGNKSGPLNINNVEFSDLTNFLSETQGQGSYIFNFSDGVGGVIKTAFKVQVSIYDDPTASKAYIDYVSSDGAVYLQDSAGNDIISLDGVGDVLNWNLPEDSKVNISLSFRNPDYDSNFLNVGDEDLLKEKFVRFSYRFKYDDDEYSLIAPFSQHAFLPKQFGYFLGEDDIKTKETSTVDFMTNQVTTAGLVFDLPYSPDEMLSKMKVKEMQILYKASDEQALKVITDIDLTKVENIKGVPSEVEIDSDLTPSNQSGYTLNKIYKTTGGSGQDLTIKVTGVSSTSAATSVEIAYCGDGYKIGDSVFVGNRDGNTNDIYVKINKLGNTYIHNYKSQKPIKVLPEKEIVRVSDIIPIRAKTQEAVGNRIIYGNFQQTTESLESLKYNVSFEPKSFLSTTDSPTTLTGIELFNHTLKQGRSYQVGIVLQDRYGRSSNVILANDNEGFNSTFFAPYFNGGSDPLTWLGNSINIQFFETIKTEKNGDYVGIWSESNPMGWYSYKVVVKQQEQDYYNVYTPGAVSGNITFTGWKDDLAYQKEKSVSNIAVFNNNINKIPRDLANVGPTDNVYSSSTELINRVSQTEYEEEGSFPFLNGQTSFPYVSSDITSIRPFRELGDWTIYKGVDLQYTTIGPASGQVTTSDGTTYIYPGASGEVDPFFLDNNKNPIITTISTNKRIAFNSTNQDSGKFAKELMVFETKPVKSNLDIYYETSTSDTIENLNHAISTVSTTSGIVAGLSEITFDGITEDSEFIKPISNQFQCVDFNGLLLNDNSIIVRLTDVSYISNITNNYTSMSLSANPGSNNVPNYLTGKGFRDGDFANSDKSSPFTLTNLNLGTVAPAIYQITSKRPINRFEAGIKYKFKFDLFQSGSFVMTVEKEFILQDIKPKIHVIGVPSNREPDFTNPEKYMPARSVYRDLSKIDLSSEYGQRFVETWNHWDFCLDPNGCVIETYGEPGSPGQPHAQDRTEFGGDGQPRWRDFPYKYGSLIPLNARKDSNGNHLDALILDSSGANGGRNWDAKINHVSSTGGSTSAPTPDDNNGNDFKSSVCPGFFVYSDTKTGYRDLMSSAYKGPTTANGLSSKGTKVATIVYSSNGLEQIPVNNDVIWQYDPGNSASDFVVDPDIYDLDAVIRRASDLSRGIKNYPRYKNTRLNSDSGRNQVVRRSTQNGNAFKSSIKRSSNLEYKIKFGYLQGCKHFGGERGTLVQYVGDPIAVFGEHPEGFFGYTDSGGILNYDKDDPDIVNAPNILYDKANAFYEINKVINWYGFTTVASKDSGGQLSWGQFQNNINPANPGVGFIYDTSKWSNTSDTDFPDGQLADDGDGIGRNIPILYFRSSNDSSNTPFNNDSGDGARLVTLWITATEYRDSGVKVESDPYVIKFFLNT